MSSKTIRIIRNAPNSAAKAIPAIPSVGSIPEIPSIPAIEDIQEKIEDLSIATSPMKAPLPNKVPFINTVNQSKQITITPKLPAQLSKDAYNILPGGVSPDAYIGSLKVGAMAPNPNLRQDVANLSGIKQNTHTSKPLRVAINKPFSSTSSQSKEPVQVQELVLMDFQLEWAARIEEIVQVANGYIDLSDRGNGKTILAIRTALKFGLKIIAVVPAIAYSVWEDEIAKYGANSVCIVTYEALASQRNRQPKCGLVVREDSVNENGVDQVHYKPTKEYLDLVSKGVLVVCDEFFKIKNASGMEKACAALLHPIVRGNNPSRYAFLSSTKFETPKSAVLFLKMAGYIEQEELYRKEKDDIIFLGVQDLLDECNFINEEKTNEILSSLTLSNKPRPEVEKLCFDLLNNVIVDAIAGYTVRPDIEGVVFDMKNGFYNIEDIDNLVAAVTELSTILDNTKGAHKFTAMTVGSNKIEKIKIPDMARAAELEFKVKGSKGIFCLNSPDNIDDLYGLLIKYKPVVIKGSTPLEKRGKLIEKFNNDPNCRAIIITSKLATSISLHDLYGDFPRFQFISPSHKLSETAQAAGRAYRHGVRSNVKVRIFYGKDTSEAELECIEKVLDSRSGFIADELTIRQPRDYECFIEQ